MDSIPVIDLDFFTNCEITDSVLNDVKTKEIAEEIRIALHEVGFMYLINHRVPPVVVRLKIYNTSRIFPLLIAISTVYIRSRMHLKQVSRFSIWIWKRKPSTRKYL